MKKNVACRAESASTVRGLLARFDVPYTLKAPYQGEAKQWPDNEVVEEILSTTLAGWLLLAAARILLRITSAVNVTSHVACPMRPLSCV